MATGIGGVSAQSDTQNKPSFAMDIVTLHQLLPTSGARTALPFQTSCGLYLIVPQLAEDIAGEPPYMNGGNSDIPALLYKWQNGKFEEHDKLPVPGGEDAVFFQIGEDCFLATASVRTGRGPYNLNAKSTLFKQVGDKWEVFQSFDTFAAKQWHHFRIDGRHFLALAQGVTIEGAVARHPRHSRIYEWNGAQFAPFQTIEGAWGYNWAYFELAGDRFLAYADHTSISRLYRWDGSSFIIFQELAPQGGRAFKYFEVDEQSWLAFASITGTSVLYRWDGVQFIVHQSLGGPGGREFELIKTATALHLVRICFIQGTPAAPKTDLTSDIYRWQDGHFALISTIPTFGGTDAEAFHVDGQDFLAVSNSLTSDIRFRQDTMIYRLTL